MWMELKGVIMRIAIYGAGSLGTILGAFITKGGMEVDLITRNRNHVEGLKKRGAQIIGTLEFNVPVKALLPEQMEGKYGLIFLMTKQTDNTNVVKVLSKYLTGEGVICTMQNGLPEISVAEVIGKERTFGCAVAWGATLKGNGVCELTSSPESMTFSLGYFGIGRTEKLQLIKEVLELMGTVVIESNFIGARWSKLIVNSAFSGISAILGCTFGEVAQNKLSRLWAQRIIKECIDVTKAAGITIEPIQGKNIARLLDYNGIIKKKISNMLIPIAIRKHRLLKASILQDLENGKKTEIDAINGIVSEYGRKYNIPTLFNNLIIEIIHDMEKGIYRPSMENLALFKDIINQ